MTASQKPDGQLGAPSGHSASQKAAIGNRGACDIAAQPFECLARPGATAHPRMQGEAVKLGTVDRPPIAVAPGTMDTPPKPVAPGTLDNNVRNPDIEGRKGEKPVPT